jgi:amphi-Trp domain-containing protein
MEESQQDQLITPDEAGGPAEAAGAVEAAERAEQAEPDEPVEAAEAVEPEESKEAEEPQQSVARPKSVEAEIEETLTRTKIISRLKAIVIELEGGSLVIGGVPVAELADEVEFELDYSEKDGKHELEIELEW